MDFWEKYRLQVRLTNPLYRRQFRVSQLAEAQRLVENDLLSWCDGQWEVYQPPHHVKTKGDYLDCDCEIFQMVGYCAHVWAVKLKEKGENDGS